MEELWIPELEVWNTGLDIFSKDKYAAESEVIVYANGSVNWMTPITINSHCDLVLKDYPFDVNECQISLGIKEYQSKEVKFAEKGIIQNFKKIKKFNNNFISSLYPHSTSLHIWSILSK